MSRSSPRASAFQDFTPAEIARAKAFRSALRIPALAGSGCSLVFLLVLASTPLGARLVPGREPGAGARWPLSLLIGTVVVLGLLRLVTLPTALLRRRVLLRYGMTRQPMRAWCADAVRGWLLSTALAYLGLLALVALARSSPTRWWIPAVVVAVAAVAFGSAAVPLVVEPLFNRFVAMPDSSLRTSLLALAHDDGITVGEVLVADASRRTTGFNAYVSGVGPTRRVVLFDTLVDGAGADEIRTVVAHELGHVKHHDVARGTTAGALGAVAGVGVLFAALRAPWLLDRADVEGAGDVHSVALVLALAGLVGAVLAPAFGVVSRRMETRADRYALDRTRDPGTFVSVQRRLALANLSDVVPSAVVYGLFATHPSAPERIASARAWARVHAVPVPSPSVEGSAAS